MGIVTKKEALANTLECKVSSLPVKYLGLPLGVGTVGWDTTTR